jgi:hypothetical protein
MTYEHHLAKIENDLAICTWLMGTNLALTLVIILLIGH